VTLLHIDAPHFCAGALVDDAGIVRRTAPILAYMRGWSARRVTGYCARKRWNVFYSNESLGAGKPMIFLCAECMSPMTVPECYVIKPSLCPDCGGEWSQ
jgi:hypothetical protein